MYVYVSTDEYSVSWCTLIYTQHRTHSVLPSGNSGEISLVHAMVSSLLDHRNALSTMVWKSATWENYSCKTAWPCVLDVVNTSHLFLINRTGSQSLAGYILKILVLVYWPLHCQALCGMLQVVTSSRALRSQSQHISLVPKTRLKTCGDRAFSHAGPILWNSLLHQANILIVF